MTTSDDGPAEARGRRRLPTLSGASSHAPSWKERHWTSRSLHRVSDGSSHAMAGVIASAVIVAWVLLGLFYNFPTWWATALYATTASITMVMTFVIQHTQARQTAATQRKLDELIRTSATANDSLIALEEAPDQHLQALNELTLADRQWTD